jgi:hypothetical protein
MRKVISVIFFIAFFVNSLAQDLYIVSKAKISFTSDAPLELIAASSDQLTGLLETSSRSFAFKVTMNSFKGFNSALQQTHFNEHYIESAKFPYTTFEGKIIEEVNLNTPGKYSLRGKGSFVCHGVKQERIIKCDLTVLPGKIKVSQEFTVLLSDHNIKIPAVVYQKIAEEIVVHIEIELVPQKQ